jgi:TorA maturation chaperone TorD
MPLPSALQAIIDFVRRGYPQGVPEHDYLPLFALLRRRLSDDEVAELASALAEDPLTAQNPAAISDAIEKLTAETPSENDIERVRAQLAAAGWTD